MVTKNRTLRLPFECEELFRMWPEPLQPNRVYIRADGLELVVGTEEDVYALVGVHIPDHPRDIPSARLIRSNLDSETQPLLFQRMSALVALWPPDIHELLRHARNRLRSFEERLADGEDWRDVMQECLDAPENESLLAPLHLLEVLAQGRTEEALQAWSAFPSTEATQTTPADEFAITCALILRGRGQDAYRRLETLPVRHSVTAHRGWTRIALHLGALEHARKHWSHSLSRDDAKDVIGLAEVTLDVGREDMALRLAGMAQTLNPTSPTLLRRIADVLLHCGDLDAAISLLTGSGNTELSWRAAELALYGGRCQQARDILAPTKSSATNETLDRLEGISLVLEGDYAKAITVLRPLEASVEAAFWLVEAYIRSHDLDLAFDVLSRAKDAMGEHPVERLLLGAIAIPKTWRKSDHKHRAIIRSLLGLTPDFEAMTDEEEQGLILTTLSRLGGNRSERLTLIDEGGLLRSMRHVISPRTQAIRTQHLIRVRSIDWVQGQFVSHQAAEPTIPFWRTYSAELDLWQGDYEEAHQHFRASWDEQEETRWMYVGLGATLTMMERFDEALEIFESGIEKLGEMSPGEATWAYRGEIALRRGQVDEAIEELERAIALRPSRIGSRLVLAIAYLEADRFEDAERVVRESSPASDILFWEAHRALGVDPSTSPGPDRLKEILHESLEFLVGNRSSYLLTFRSASGAWHVHPIEGHVQECASLASRLLPLAWEDLASRVISGPFNRS